MNPPPPAPEILAQYAPAWSAQAYRRSMCSLVIWLAMRLFRFPTVAQNLVQALKIAAQQALLHAKCFFLDGVHGVESQRVAVAHIARLLLNDVGRGAGFSREVEEQRGLKLGDDPILDAQRVDEHVAVAAELHKVEAAEGRGILILLAALEAGLNALDDEGRMREFVVAEGKIEPLGIGRQHGHSERGGRTKAGTGRHVDPRAHAQAERLAVVEFADHVVVDGLEKVEAAVVGKHRCGGVGGALMRDRRRRTRPCSVSRGSSAA